VTYTELIDMNEAICIDLGTSSIRGVYRSAKGVLKVLAIGEVTKSQLDDASIRCDIHVDESGRDVRFGEQAIKAHSNRTGTSLYESSPKLWLKDPRRLGNNAKEGLEVTREQLLVGLMAYAIRAIADAGPITPQQLERIDLRISHPVWPDQVKTRANRAIFRILDQARRIAFKRQRWGQVSIKSLHKLLNDNLPAPNRHTDVVEPIAAAVALLPDEDNKLRICAVVDIGAGTTDIALFISLIPDEDAKMTPTKLYQIGQPVSVFKAGNDVDRIVVKLLRHHAKKRGREALAEVVARIRGVKETLFEIGLIQELGCDINLNDLENHEDATAMATEIRVAFEDLAKEHSNDIFRQLDRAVHAPKCLDVVMAGGGGSIAFVVNALKTELQIGQRIVAVNVKIPTAKPNFDMCGASRGRLAVALGGADEEYEKVQHEQPTLVKINRGLY
jgi:hypothetical protein